MKTAISISDALFREAEKLARRLRKSRSQLYGEAMSEYLRRHDPEAVTEALDRVCARIDEPIDLFVDTAARHRLAASQW
jgi:predicted transcriptional regulator